MEKSVRRMGRPREFDRDEALDCAVDLFLEKGFEASSLEDITSRLKINRPSLYGTFGNKEELFIEALERYHHCYRQFFSYLSSQQLPIERFLEQWLGWFLETFEGQRKNLGCLVVNSTSLCCEEHPLIIDRLKELHSTNQQLLTTHFQERQKRGEIASTADPSALAQFYGAVVLGLAVMQRAQKGRAALKTVIDSALRSWSALNS